MDPTFWTALVGAAATVLVGFMNFMISRSARVKVKEIHDFVNSKDKVNTETIEGLTRQVNELRDEILRRADAAPAQGSLAAVPQPVTIEGTKEPLPVTDVTPKR